MGFGTSEGGSESGSTGAENVSVGTSTTAVVAANPDRIYFACTNDHASNNIYLGLGEDAVANKGIRLNSGGGSWECPIAPDGKAVFRGAINAIADGASTTLTYVEMT